MAHEWLELVGEPVTSPLGPARVVSRVDVWTLGPLVASRHRPIAVEVAGEAGVERHPVRAPGVVVLAAYALLVLAILRRRR